MQQTIYQHRLTDADELHKYIVVVWEEMDQPVINTAVRQWLSLSLSDEHVVIMDSFYFVVWVCLKDVTGNFFVTSQAAQFGVPCKISQNFTAYYKSYMQLKLSACVWTETLKDKGQIPLHYPAG